MKDPNKNCPPGGAKTKNSKPRGFTKRAKKWEISQIYPKI